MSKSIKVLRRKAREDLRQAVLGGAVPVAVFAARLGRSERTIRTWLDGKDPPSTAIEAIASAIHEHLYGVK